MADTKVYGGFLPSAGGTITGDVAVTGSVTASTLKMTTGAAVGVVVSDGSGNLVADKTPALGTPASGDLQNCTASTTSAKGVVELATNAEALIGEDVARALTAANLRYVLSRYQPRENLIGIAGQAGFGVGVCPIDELPTGMTPMAGYDVLGDDNYGN